MGCETCKQMRSKEPNKLTKNMQKCHTVAVWHFFCLYGECVKLKNNNFKHIIELCRKEQ